MNKKRLRIAGALAAFTLTASAMVTTKQLVETLADSSATFAIGWGAASGDAGTYANFTAASGTATIETGKTISFTTAQNQGTTAPTYNANNSDLRLYYHTGGNGGSITFNLASFPYTVTRVVLWSTTSPSVNYSIDGGAATSVTASNNFYTISGISAASSIRFQNVNTANTQLRIKTVEFTYTIPTAKVVSSVDVQTSPTKTEYKIGETFDPTGLVVRVTYTDSTHDDVAYSALNSAKFAFIGFDSSDAENDQQVTVKYTPVSDQFTCATKVLVDIIEVTPNAILVDVSGLDKDPSTYRVGNTLDLTGLVITIGYTDKSETEYEITSNAEFEAKGFSLKVDDSPFSLSSALTVDYDGKSFVVFYGELYDDSDGDTIDVTVENIATFSVTNFGTTKFYRNGNANQYLDSYGVVGSGSAYSAFEGYWYVNGTNFQTKSSKNTFFFNVTPLGRIKTITLNLTDNAKNSVSAFTMNYGDSPKPSSSTVSGVATTSQQFTYDFSAVNANYFQLRHTSVDNALYITSIVIDYAPNALLDRTEAGAFADYFLAITDGLCDEDGIENGVADVWAKLSGVFGLLSSETKASLKSTALEEKGVSDGTTVGNAMARYYLATKNHDANTDFIGGGDIKAAANKALPMDSNENSSAITITIVLAASFLAAGGFAFMAKRHRKED